MKGQEGRREERPALLIIDMVKDNFREDKPLPITPFAREIIAPINRMIRVFRVRGWPIVFATDAFERQDFIFKGRMEPYSIAGTTGAEVIEALERTPADLWLPKPRFSAFFDTELDQWLNHANVNLCAVAGIATNFCVLTTVMDALCHGFKAVLLEDCTAAISRTVHEQILSVYRRNPLYPLFKVTTAGEFMAEMGAEAH